MKSWLGKGGSTKSCGSMVRPARPIGLERQLGAGDAADQEAAKLVRRHLIKPAAHFTDHVLADDGGAEAPVEKPFSRFRKAKGLCQQSAEIEDGDAALAQRIDEYVMLLARPLDPEHIVEQQRLADCPASAAAG